jgi:hypothetical protein
VGCVLVKELTARSSVNKDANFGGKKRGGPMLSLSVLETGFHTGHDLFKNVYQFIL